MSVCVAAVSVVVCAQERCVWCSRWVSGGAVGEGVTSFDLCCGPPFFFSSRVRLPVCLVVGGGVSGGVCGGGLRVEWPVGGGGWG